MQKWCDSSLPDHYWVLHYTPFPLTQLEDFVKIRVSDQFLDTIIKYSQSYEFPKSSKLNHKKQGGVHVSDHWKMKLECHFMLELVLV